MNRFAQTLTRGGALSRQIARKTREVGLLGLLRHVTARLAQHPDRDAQTDAFDSTYGTDTVKMVARWALDGSPEQLEHANRYETVAPEVFSASLAELKIAHEDFGFIDLGSGKGRALLLASRFPFKEIIGVEFSARLNEIAHQNLQIFKDPGQRCRNIRAFCQDATDYQFPDENLVVYLYNPFDAHVMQAVVTRLEQRLRNSSRRVFVLYHHPHHRHVWDRSPAFQAIRIQDRVAVYANKN